MQERVSLENRLGLKSVIEGTHSDISPTIPLQQAKLDLLTRQLGASFDYDGAMQLHRGADEFAKQCGPFDPAYSKFSGDAIAFLKYATLLNNVHSLGRHEHQELFKVLVDYNGEVAECEVWIDKQDMSSAKKPEALVKGYLEARLRQAGMYSHRFGANHELQFVIL